jgi:hypothetical protein
MLYTRRNARRGSTVFANFYEHSRYLVHYFWVGRKLHALQGLDVLVANGMGRRGATLREEASESQVARREVNGRVSLAPGDGVGAL